jgi:HAD superfamily hydrolase (TIGR01509 family)
MAATRCILWDNDGVLVETESLFRKATERSLKEFNIAFQTDLFEEVYSAGGLNFIEYLCGQNELSSQIISQRDSTYKWMLENSSIEVEGLSEVLSQLAKSFRMGIVTGSTLEVLQIQHRHTTLLNHFDFIVTSEEYDNPKPNPEPYRRAIERYGLQTSTTLVIEDSTRGLLAAQEAGLTAIEFKISDSLKADVRVSLDNLVIAIEDFFRQS